MPIYAYRCTTCGNAQDVLRKISDPPLTVCPACGAATFVKQVTAAGFQLKGSGWYVTDFRDDKKKTKTGDGAGQGDKPAGDANGATATSDGAKSSDAAGTTPAPAAAASTPASAAPASAPAPATAPAPSVKSDKGGT
jgi:putative FmdB family regulatory protein